MSVVELGAVLTQVKRDVIRRFLVRDENGRDAHRMGKTELIEDVRIDSGQIRDYEVGLCDPANDIHEDILARFNVVGAAYYEACTR